MRLRLKFHPSALLLLRPTLASPRFHTLGWLNCHVQANNRWRQLDVVLRSPRAVHLHEEGVKALVL